MTRGRELKRIIKHLDHPRERSYFIPTKHLCNWSHTMAEQQKVNPVTYSTSMQSRNQSTMQVWPLNVKVIIQL